MVTGSHNVLDVFPQRVPFCAFICCGIHCPRNTNVPSNRVVTVLNVLWSFDFICGFMYLVFATSLTFFIRAYEKNGFFEAVVRSFKLVKDKWWSTFGLVMILYFIMVVVSYLFIVPWQVVSGVSMFHSLSTNTFEEPSTSWKLITTVVFSLQYMVQMVLAGLSNIGIAFQYFNLVEMKEAKGLMTQIETLGQQAPSTSAQEEHY